MATPPLKATNSLTHHPRPLAAEPRAADPIDPVGVRPRIAAAPPSLPPSEPSVAWSSRPRWSQDERADYEDTMVDSGIAERIATELAREQAMPRLGARLLARKALAPRLGPYRLLRLLASGQTSLVHLARSEAPAERAGHLAIRSLRREHGRAAQRALAFVENARLFSALRHDSLVRVHDAGVDAGTPYVVMDYLHGKSLRAALQQRPGGLPLDFAVTAIGCCAQALHHARLGQAHHGARYLGISPSYVMACADGTIKLFRLGLTEVLAPAPTRSELAYLAPELARGETCDARSDVFSLGVMLYELITGVHPYFDAPSSPTDRDLHARIKPLTRYLPHLARELADVVMTAIARRPEDRYPDCLEFGRILRAVSDRVAVRTGLAAVRQLVDRLMGAGPDALQMLDDNKVTNIRVLPDPEPFTDQLTGARVAVARSEPASTTPSATERQPLSPPALAPRCEPASVPALTLATATTPASPRPAPPLPQPVSLQGPKVGTLQPLGSLPSASSQLARFRSANKLGVPHVAAPRRDQPPADAPRPLERAPHRVFQAVVLLCGATVATAAVALAVSASTQPMTTAEPTITARVSSGARASAPDEPLVQDPAADQTWDPPEQPPPAPPLQDTQPPSDMVYEYPVPDPPVFSPPDPPEETPPTLHPQLAEASGPSPDADSPPPPDAPQQDLSDYQPPRDLPDPSTQAP